MNQDLWSTNQYSLEFWFTQEIARSPLLVPECEMAELVYMPLSTLWAVCSFKDVHDKINHFVSNLQSFLPLLHLKPHFMVLPRVSFWSGVDLQHLLTAGITILTIEGPISHLVVELPYPAYYHHNGQHHNRFIHNALSSKNRLAYECFATAGHGSLDLEFRAQLLAACWLLLKLVNMWFLISQENRSTMKHLTCT